jgi:hypothetical protein
LLFVKYVTDKAKSDPNSLIEVPNGGSFDDMLALSTPAVDRYLAGQGGEGRRAGKGGHR